MLIISEYVISSIVCDSQVLIEKGVKKVVERTGKPGQGIDTGLREISEGIGGLKAVQQIMTKAYNTPRKVIVNYGE